MKILIIIQIQNVNFNQQKYYIRKRCFFQFISFYGINYFKKNTINLNLKWMMFCDIFILKIEINIFGEEKQCEM